MQETHEALMGHAGLGMTRSQMELWDPPLPALRRALEAEGIWPSQEEALTQGTGGCGATNSSYLS